MSSAPQQSRVQPSKGWDELTLIEIRMLHLNVKSKKAHSLLHKTEIGQTKSKQNQTKPQPGTQTIEQKCSLPAPPIPLLQVNQANRLVSRDLLNWHLRQLASVVGFLPCWGGLGFYLHGIVVCSYWFCC